MLEELSAGEALGIWRRRSGLTQRELARQVQVAQAYLSELESGRKAPSLQVAAKIENVTEGAIRAVSWVHLDAEDVAEETAHDHA